MANLRPHLFRLDLVQTRVDRDARDPMFERHLAGELREFLKYLNEDHLGKVLFRSASRSMGPDHFRDKRIQSTNQLTSRVIIMLKRGCNQSACSKIIHVSSVSTTVD